MDDAKDRVAPRLEVEVADASLAAAFTPFGCCPNTATAEEENRWSTRLFPSSIMKFFIVVFKDKIQCFGALILSDYDALFGWCRHRKTKRKFSVSLLIISEKLPCR